MKKTVIAIALATTLPVAAQAAPAKGKPATMASKTMTVNAPTLYGQFNMSTDLIDDGSNKRGFIESNESRIGIMGNQRVADGINAKYVAEWGFTGDNADSDAAADADEEFTSRDRYVALETAYGAVRWGAFSSPIRNVQGNVDRFDDLKNFDMSTGLQVTRDDRYDNAVGFTSPTFMGFTADVAYSAAEQVGADLDTGSLAVNYAKQGYSVGVAAEKIEAQSGTALRVAASAPVGDTAQVGALYQDDDKANNQKTALISGQCTVGHMVYKAQLARIDNNGTDTDAIALGVDHNFNKDVTVYAVLGFADAGANDTTALSAGVKYKF